MIELFIIFQYNGGITHTGVVFVAITYEQFLTMGMDLAPLGLDMRGEHTPYFCTPKDAQIIGCAGVDGIHFCFIKGFGETVFAVSPCNDIGSYVHPIARSFEDFLSLIVSTGNIAAMEQAWMWDEKEFYQFLQENLSTDEQDAILLKLELSVPVMEEPFDYIKKLQAEFDYSKIPFTAEYYEVVGEEAKPPQKPREWKVYYDNGYWKSGTNKTRPGTELAVNGSFTWGDEIWHVPAVYLCGKGLVIDYCVEIQPEKVKAFLDKWYPTRDEPRVSNEIRRQMEAENPLEIDFRSHCMFNGKVLRQKTGSSLSYIPQWCLPGEVENPPETLEIIAHYGLDPAKAWSFHRHCCPWATLRKPRAIKSFAVRLERHPETIQGIHFANPSVGDVVTFTHPITGTQHKLTVLEYAQQELSTKAFAHEEYEFPTHHTAMTYTLEPPLPGAAFTVRDCLENEAARRMPKKPYEPDAAYDACIGIIGGADGPTAIVVSPKNRSREIHAALSALHFEPTSHVEWKMEFRAKMMEDVEITLL